MNQTSLHNQTLSFSYSFDIMYIEKNDFLGFTDNQKVKAKKQWEKKLLEFAKAFICFSIKKKTESLKEYYRDLTFTVKIQLIKAQKEF